jgi:hypothetical protein
MNDFFKDKRLTEINDNLDKINSRMGNYWFAFGRGLLTGFGSVLGAGIAILLIGWFLNIIGVIPAFKSYTDDLRNAFDQTQNNKSFIPSDSAGTPE